MGAVQSLAFLIFFGAKTYADIDSGSVSSAIENILGKLSSLLYFGAVIMGLYGLYAYSQADKESDPHAKGKAMQILQGAAGTGIVGLVIQQVLRPLVSNLFS